MTDKWDRSIKGDFQKAHNGGDAPAKSGSGSEKYDAEVRNGGHDKIGDGPRPPVEGRPAPEVVGSPGPGGSVPSKSAVDRHRASRQGNAERAVATPDITKDDPKLSRNFNNRSTR